MTGQQDDLGLGVLRLYLGQDLNPGHPGHFYVHDDHVNRVLSQNGQALLSVSGLFGIQPSSPEPPHQRLAKFGFVVNQQQSDAVVHLLFLPQSRRGAEDNILTKESIVE
jgi:hypothetical protein